MGTQHCATQAAAFQKCYKQGPLECNILGLGGQLCTVSLSKWATLQELRADIEDHCGVPQWSQRLCCALTELRSDGDLARLAARMEVLDLTLVRRPEEQARWLQELDASCSAFDWMAGAEEGARADKDVVMVAVARDGRALKFAAPELRADREVALAAVSRSWLALRYAAPELQADSEVTDAAVTRDWGPVQYAAREPREALELDSHIFVSLGLLVLFLCSLLLHRWAASCVLAASLGFVHFVYDPRNDLEVESQYYAGLGLGFALLLCLAAVDGKFWFWAAQAVAAVGAGLRCLLASREWFLLPPRLHAFFRLPAWVCERRDVSCTSA